jgi:hypothetical protein
MSSGIASFFFVMPGLSQPTRPRTRGSCFEFAGGHARTVFPNSGRGGVSCPARRCFCQCKLFFMIPVSGLPEPCSDLALALSRARRRSRWLPDTRCFPSFC